MNAKQQTIPEADDIAELTKQDAAQLMLERVKVIEGLNQIGPVATAKRLWPELSKQAGLE